MSQKNNYKNLSYTATLPPFLARLRGHNPSGAPSDGPDPILAARRRPGGKKRSASEEAEDAPLVVDDEGNSVQAHVAADGSVTVKKAEDGDEAADKEKGEKKSEGDDEYRNVKKQEVAAIGAGKKKRAARVVGGDDEETVSKYAKSKGSHGSKQSLAESKPAVKPKKKAKRIKLSFDEE